MLSTSASDDDVEMEDIDGSAAIKPPLEDQSKSTAPPFVHLYTGETIKWDDHGYHPEDDVRGFVYGANLDI